MSTTFFWIFLVIMMLGMPVVFALVVAPGISLVIDGRYEPRALGRYYYWIIWYPMVYWGIHAAASVVAVPKALHKRRGSRAVWVSPDRGVRARPAD